MGAVPLVIQLPIGSEADFEGIVDILNMKEVVWKQDTLGAEFEIKEIRSELKDKAEDYRKKLVELAVELDDNVMEQYLEGNEPDVATLKSCIRKGTIKGNFVPTLCGTAFKNKGVQPMLDAVVDFLPSPLDLPPVKGITMDGEKELQRKCSDEESFSALAFKIMTTFCCTLAFARDIRILQRKHSRKYSKRKRKNSRMLQMAASREDIKEARTGDIIA